MCVFFFFSSFFFRPPARWDPDANRDWDDAWPADGRRNRGIDVAEDVEGLEDVDRLSLAIEARNWFVVAMMLVYATLPGVLC